MAYEKQTWANGDIITAQRLNHMEDGIAASSSNYDLMVTITDDSITADGLSIEELIQKGVKNLNAALDEKGIFKKTIGLSAEVDEDPLTVDSVTFFFSSDIGDYTGIILCDNDTAEFMIYDSTSENYSYTYSDGHYTFTPAN